MKLSIAVSLIFKICLFFTGSLHIINAILIMIQTLRQNLNHSRGSNEYLISWGKEAVLHFAMDEVCRKTFNCSSFPHYSSDTRRCNTDSVVVPLIALNKSAI